MAQSAAARAAAFEALYERASAAGQAAGQAARPAPMIVGTAVGLSDALDLSQPLYYEAEGVCGFAWVRITPGNGSFARWASRTGKARKAYGGGVQVWVREHGQSYQRKAAHADAFAAVLREAGVPAYAEGRLD